MCKLRGGDRSKGGDFRQELGRGRDLGGGRSREGTKGENMGVGRGRSLGGNSSTGHEYGMEQGPLRVKYPRRVQEPGSGSGRGQINRGLG